MKQTIAAFALLLTLNAQACADHDLQTPSVALQVVNAAVSTAKADGPLLVTVIGELKNTTNDKINDVVIEARLTDASGKVIDVLSESQYGLVVPPGEQVSFRLQGAAATTQAAYVGVQARVVSAQAHSASTPRRPSSREGTDGFKEFAISWGPMVLLVLVWIFMARKYSGKGSNQDKMLIAINEQNALLTRQSAAIETIANALSSRGNSPEDGR